MKTITGKKLSILMAASAIAASMLNSCEKTRYDLLDPESAGVWTLYNTQTGLPSNQVKDIVRDRDDNLWVTFAASGAGKLTDDVWTFYQTSNSDILSNAVTALASRSDGTVIIGTSNGLSFVSSSGVWTSYKDPAVTTMNITCITETPDGWIWVGTQGQGFYVNDGSGFFQIYSASFANVRAIISDRDNNVYIGTDNGLLKWDGSGYTLYTTAHGLPSNQVMALFSDSRGRIWISASGGLTVAYLYDSVISQLSLMNGTAGTNVRDIYEDRRGDIWFATWDDGLIRYDGVIAHSYKVYNGFFEDDVNCIGEDSDGNLWFGLYSEGLVKYTLPIN